MRIALLISVGVLLSCGAPQVSTTDAGASNDAGRAIDAGVEVDAGRPVLDAGIAAGEYDRETPGYPNRGFDLLVPTGAGPHPVLFMLHGGGGSRGAARRTACPAGVPTSPRCLHALALAQGYVVVFPEGTGAVARTWNSGGGSDGWQCVSGPACIQNIDEKAYFTAVIDSVAALTPIDRTRLYATGLSNGASMAERLACELDGISAIASVAGGNQWSTTRACTRAVSVLEIHGTGDPCWNFDGGPASCADSNPGSKISVPDTIARWSINDGCDGGVTITLVPDAQSDGTTTRHHVYACATEALELYEVLDGGHTWPQGYSFSSMGGPIAQDFSANDAILTFFAAH